MKTYYDQRRALSIHTRHFGEASQKARLTYGILLILFALILLMNSWISEQRNDLNTVDRPINVEMAAPAFTGLVANK